MSHSAHKLSTFAIYLNYYSPKLQLHPDRASRLRVTHYKLHVHEPSVSSPYHAREGKWEEPRNHLPTRDRWSFFFFFYSPVGMPPAALDELRDLARPARLPRGIKRLSRWNWGRIGDEVRVLQCAAYRAGLTFVLIYSLGCCCWCEARGIRYYSAVRLVWVVEVTGPLGQWGSTCPRSWTLSFFVARFVCIARWSLEKENRIFSQLRQCNIYHHFYWMYLFRRSFVKQRIGMGRNCSM